ncbi:hypothetical protein PENTCL1PPCAC_3408, partial [Pristionchus entomophagus]
HLNVRSDFKITCNFEGADQDPAPHKFNDRHVIRSPDESRVLTVRECITLADVVAYREDTTRLATRHNADFLSELLDGLSIEEKKQHRVIYRFTDMLKDDSMAILEAIHFELFMPERPVLRFIALPIDQLPIDSCEGDYFE